MSENIRSSTFLVKNKKDSFFSIEFGKNPLSTYFIWFDKSSIHLLLFWWYSVNHIYYYDYIIIIVEKGLLMYYCLWCDWYEVVNFYIYYYYFLFTTKTCIKSINIPWNGKNVKLNAESLYLILNKYTIPGNNNKCVVWLVKSLIYTFICPYKHLRPCMSVQLLRYYFSTL